MKNNISMRALFAQILYKEMKKNNKIIVLTSDLGYGMWDEIKKDFPQRFLKMNLMMKLMYPYCDELH